LKSRSIPSPSLGSGRFFKLLRNRSLLYYDRELRRANRLFDVLFLAADSFLAAVFALAGLLPVLTEN